MYPGKSWADCHRLAEREILAGLLQIGVFRANLDDGNVYHFFYFMI